MEVVYFMTTDQPDQPTNEQPTGVPVCYVSLRLTMDHSRVEDIKEKILNGYEYVGYTHLGKSGDNPHFHFFIPTADKRTAECIRKRAKDKFTLSGNGRLSVTYRCNGILNGITYGSKEGTTAIVSSDDMARLVNLAPAYVHQEKPGMNMYNHFKVDKDKSEAQERKIRNWVLTYNNLVPQAVIHAKRHHIVDYSLRYVVKHMIMHTNWRPSRDMYRGGVPECYEKDYEFVLGQRKEPDMDWYNVKL